MPEKNPITEIWKPIPSWEGIYEVSNLGNVRRIRPAYIKQHSKTGGYLYVRLTSGKRHYYPRVHTVVAAAFLGARPDGYQVNHKNGKKADNQVDNLEYLTPLDNIKHAVENHLYRDCERHPTARFSNDDIRRMRRLVSSGVPQVDVAKQFGISKHYIWEIVHRKAWTGLP